MVAAHTTVTEVWKPVVGFEGWYSVSNIGRVRRDKPSNTTKAGHVLKPHVGNSGYYFLHLKAAHQRTYKQPHRLVAEAFIGSGDGLQVNHINGDKLDNRLENLEWATPSENMQHAHRVLEKLIGSGNGQAKITEADVAQIRCLYATGRYFQREIGEMYGLTQTTVGDIVRRDSWTHVE